MNAEAKHPRRTCLRELTTMALGGLLALGLSAHAHDGAAASGADAQASTGTPADIDGRHAAMRQSFVTIADAFSDALKAGDLERVGDFLAEDVLILESGGSERTREEYLHGHAGHDAAFLKDAQVRLLHRTVRTSEHMVWIGSEREVHATRDGKPMTLLSTETLVFGDTPRGWKIVHIHWSSRPLKAGEGNR
ncbi:YybH family protein [Marilutibacter chinensis]|uniref:Nuclear transport factor 2 family protein n=1 Tax=Marilutibacter chinensis TaxID=2912247 RepID=A0ABS9HQ21_9GAMM|nr:nuclear transport factor 2 family protein [Lysobacter chinensis]MCF7220407.1 nuclear transport factor 2 family protein [Lysobacter chinensis]